MPTYIIERTFAKQLDLTTEDIRLIEDINADEGVRWLFSFLSADRLCTYCLYEAPSTEAIMAAAKRANIPADAIVEVEPQPLGAPGRAHEWAAAQAGPQR
jgi:Nickel responsive protein SCO4226-like